MKEGLTGNAIKGRPFSAQDNKDEENCFWVWQFSRPENVKKIIMGFLCDYIQMKK
jgi:hypothetical protein